MSQQPNKVDPEVARLLSKLSPEDINDLLATKGVGSLQRQVGVQMKVGASHFITRAAGMLATGVGSILLFILVMGLLIIFASFFH